VGPSERKTVECISGACGLADAHGRDTSAEGLQRGGEHGQQPHDASPGDGCDRPGPTNGFWSTCDWLLCRDDKWRSVEPGTFPLAHGATSRVGRLRAYGNAINLAQATEFVKACAK
jgi:DNA (cytosine-5)-methyltransferase 1